MIDTIFDVLRWTNVLLSGFAVALMVTTLMRRWCYLTRRIRRIGVAVCGLLVVCAYGSGESLAMDLEPAVRVPILTVALAGLVWACLYRFNDVNSK